MHTRRWIRGGAGLLLGLGLVAGLQAAPETFWGETATHRIKIQVLGNRVLRRWSYRKKPARAAAAARPAAPSRPAAAPRTSAPPQAVAAPAVAAPAAASTPSLSVGARSASGVPPVGAGWLVAGLVLIGAGFLVRRREVLAGWIEDYRQRAFEGLHHPFWHGDGVEPAMRRRRVPSHA